MRVLLDHHNEVILLYLSFVQTSTEKLLKFLSQNGNVLFDALYTKRTSESLTATAPYYQLHHTNWAPYGVYAIQYPTGMVTAVPALLP